MANHHAELPEGCELRPAQASDIWPIRRLVLMAALDPTQIRWQQFWVIETAGEVVACGQLRQFADAQELGSLVVSRPWRGRGLGSALTQHLIEQANQALYLECLGDRLAQFYEQFGFVRVDGSTLLPGLQQKFRLSRLAQRLRIPVVFLHYPSDE